MGKRNLFLYLFLIVFFVYFFLFAMVRMGETEIYKDGGFNRNWLDYKFKSIATVSIGPNIYTLSGFTSSSLFFSGADPTRLYSFDYLLHANNTFFSPFPIDRKMLNGFDLNIDSPVVRLFSRNNASMYFCNLGDTAIRRTKFDVALFTKAVSVNNSSVFLRAFDSTRTDQFFSLVDIESGSVVKRIGGFKKSQDAGFSKDGLLLYDRYLKRIVYVQFYGNEFLCFNDSGTLMYSSKTIDTVNSSQIKTKILISDKKGSIMPSTPLKVVNKTVCVDGGVLFVVSKVRAKNEPENVFRNNSVIDLYELANGRYKGSFHIPKFNGNGIESLQMIGHKVVVVFPGHLELYSFM